MCSFTISHLSSSSLLAEECRDGVGYVHRASLPFAWTRDGKTPDIGTSKLVIPISIGPDRLALVRDDAI